MGTLIKDWWAPKYATVLDLKPEATSIRSRVYHVSVMPCYDKKLEASRPDFADAEEVRDVDCVLTTGEVAKMLAERNCDLVTLARQASMASPTKSDAAEAVFPDLLQHLGTSSGSYLHGVIGDLVRRHAQDLSSIGDLRLEIKNIRGSDYVDYTLSTAQPSSHDSAVSLPRKTLFKGATCYGFRNLQNVVRKVGRAQGISVTKGAAATTGPAPRKGAVRRVVRKGATPSATVAATAPVEEERGYDYIEVMACPSGCVNGGGQLPPPPLSSITNSSARRKRGVYEGELDDEGMPRVAEAFEVDPLLDASSWPGQATLPGKEWVERVEQRYWMVETTDHADVDLAAHPSIQPFLQAPSNAINRLANGILEELCGGDEGKRRTVLRTQYRAVESEEVNGLAVKW